MPKKTLFTILRSLGIACLVAWVLAIAITSQVFAWQWFVGLLMAQFVLFEFVGMLVDRFVVAKSINRVAKEQTKLIEEAITKQSLSLTCAYCNTSNSDIPIILAEENTFKCQNCKQENIIYMQFYAARRTKPIEAIEGPGKSL